VRGNARGARRACSDGWPRNRCTYDATFVPVEPHLARRSSETGNAAAVRGSKMKACSTSNLLLWSFGRNFAQRTVLNALSVCPTHNDDLLSLLLVWWMSRSPRSDFKCFHIGKEISA
jgi:hypothetical protein